MPEKVSSESIFYRKQLKNNDSLSSNNPTQKPKQQPSPRLLSV
jgi:hypothetical protein